MAAMAAMKRSKPDGEQAFKAEPASDEDVRRRRASANRVLTYLKAALITPTTRDSFHVMISGDANLSRSATWRSRAYAICRLPRGSD